MTHRSQRRPVSLALQGGGSHGAFTWGVLDALLEDERIVIEAISGTSAGAMNAAMLLSGHARGGVQGAREALERFWLTVGGYANLSPVRRTWLDQWMGNWNLDHSPLSQWSGMVRQMVSPYQGNPLNIDPLRAVLEQQLDVEALRDCDSMDIFVAATNVRTGRARVFDKTDISLEALLASACLPYLSQAVEIDGCDYWDGGYMGNPTIWPLIYHARTNDVVLVQINPLERDEVPKTPAEISNRLDEIAFNSSLMHEMRAIAFVQRLLEQGALQGPLASHYRSMRMHMIADPDGMRTVGISSKMNAHAPFIAHLKEMGRICALQWLERHFNSLGRHSTLDIRTTFL